MLEDGIRSSRSTSSDSDDSRTDTLSSESTKSPMDLPATGWSSSKCILDMGDGSEPISKSIAEKPGVSPDLPQRHHKFLAVISGPFHKIERVARAYAQPTVVPLSSQTPQTENRYYDIVVDLPDCVSLATSEYSVGFVCCRRQSSS